MLTPLTRTSLTLDPLIAEANERARERHDLIGRRAAAALILGTTLASAGLLHSLTLGHTIGILLGLQNGPFHPWWVDAATAALCILGVTAALHLLINAPRAQAVAYTAAAVLFLTAGLEALTTTGWGVQYIGTTNLTAIFLLLGAVSAVLAVRALALCLRHRQPNQEPRTDAAS